MPVARTISLRLPEEIIEEMDRASTLETPPLTRTQYIHHAITKQLASKNKSDYELPMRAQQHLADLCSLYGGTGAAIISLALKKLLEAEIASENSLITERNKLRDSWSLTFNREEEER